LSGSTCSARVDTKLMVGNSSMAKKSVPRRFAARYALPGSPLAPWRVGSAVRAHEVLRFDYETPNWTS